MANTEKLQSYSELNTLKRLDNPIGRTTTFTYGSAGTTVTTPINHNLSYPPFYSVGVELFNDGVLWSTQYLIPYDPDVVSADQPPMWKSWTDNNTISVAVYNPPSGSLVQSGSREIRYGVYLDYDY